MDGTQTPIEPLDDGSGGRRTPYRYDQTSIPALARLADAACVGATDPQEAGLHVDMLASHADPPMDTAAKDALSHTFMYMVSVAPVEEQPDARLQPFEGRSLFPMALKDTPEDLRQLWRALAPVVQHPIIRARCWDIVFTLHLERNRRDAAEKAIRSYLDCAGSTLSPRCVAEGLLRAWTLDRLVGPTRLSHDIATAMATLAERAIAAQDDPYAATTVLNALTAPAPRASRSTHIQNPALDDLLDRALTTYPQVHLIRDVATLIRKSAGAGTMRADAASRYEVNAMLAEANAATEPMIIRTMFHDAAATARQLGLTDLEQIAVAGLQAAPVLDWSSSEYTVTTPAVFYHYYLPGFAAAGDWRRALMIWLQTASPAGSLETNAATARQVSRSSIVYRLATVVQFRDGDLPSRTIHDDDIVDRELVRVETHHMGMNGRFLARSLFQIPQRFGIPARGDLETFLTEEFGAAPALVTALVTALQLFWVGEYAASSHLVIPKVEAAVRALLLELNEPLYRAAVGDTIGQFPGLGSLLPLLLANDFDPDWERFLRCFLLNDGNNLRNLVAHGFADNVGPVEAALAIRAAALLILLTTPSATARDAATVRTTLAKPQGPESHRGPLHRLKGAFFAAWHELRR